MEKMFFGIKRNFEVAEYLNIDTAFSSNCKLCIELNSPESDVDLYAVTIHNIDREIFYESNGWKILNITVQSTAWSTITFIIEDTLKEIERASTRVDLRYRGHKYFVEVIAEVIEKFENDSLAFASSKMKKMHLENNSLKEQNLILKQQIHDLNEELKTHKKEKE